MLILPKGFNFLRAMMTMMMMMIEMKTGTGKTGTTNKSRQRDVWFSFPTKAKQKKMEKARKVSRNENGIMKNMQYFGKCPCQGKNVKKKKNEINTPKINEK